MRRSSGGSYDPKSSNTEDAYTILGVTSEASVQEIHRAFRQKSVAAHPDRVGVNGREEFERLTKARDVLLGLQEGRSEGKTSVTGVVSETINLAEMITTEDGGREWECRCGGVFSLQLSTQMECKLEEIVIGCEGCSLGLRVVAK